MDFSSDPVIQVLMVEDDEDDALLISSALNESGNGRFGVLPASNLSIAQECLKNSHVDVVLLDLFLPDSRGLESLMAIRRESADVPVVVSLQLYEYLSTRLKW